jgi:hypothetical protein
MGSSLMPDHLLNSQEAPGVRPGLQSENERLKLLLADQGSLFLDEVGNEMRSSAY